MMTEGDKGCRKERGKGEIVRGGWAQGSSSVREHRKGVVAALRIDLNVVLLLVRRSM
jgi:hypothetical protein